LEFGVDAVTPEKTAAGDGHRVAPIEPAAWLVSRGYKLAQKLTEGQALWCAAGRTMEIPAAVHGGCKLENPTPTQFALLPVSVSQQ
jgi:hypothetical protein